MNWIDVIPTKTGFRIIRLSHGLLFCYYYHDDGRWKKGKSFFVPKFVARKVMKKEYVGGET